MSGNAKCHQSELNPQLLVTQMTTEQRKELVSIAQPLRQQNQYHGKRCPLLHEYVLLLGALWYRLEE